MKLFSFNRNLKSRISDEIRKLPWKIDPNKVLSLLDHSIGIRTRPNSSECKIGESKFGGLPHLPKNVEWPILNRVPFGFLGQINLSEVKIDKSNLLPIDGLLLFFFSTRQEDYRDENLKDLHKVIFIKDLQNLYPRKYPEKYDELAKFNESKIDFYDTYSLPSYQNYKMQRLNLSDEDENTLFDAYEVIHDKIKTHQDIGHQILGNAQAVQGDVSYPWSLQSIGQKLKIISELKENERKLVERNQENIILLLQADILDNNTNFNKFGSSGALYYGIEK